MTKNNNHSLSPIADFPKLAYMVFGLGTIPFLAPFAIAGFIQGRIMLALLSLGIVCLATANALCIYRKGKVLIPYVVTYSVILAAVLWGIYTNGERVALWCYPVAIVTFFSSGRLAARIMTIISLLLLIPAAFYFMTFDFAARFSVTYLMACYFGDLVKGLIENLQEKLNQLAIIDPLTGVYNRRYMDEALQEAMEQSRRGLSSTSLIAMDIDNFKAINDSLGHLAGDDVLTAFADVVVNRLRKVDKVFRTGGEEFIVLTRDISPGQVEVLAESLRHCVERSMLLADRQVTVSLGIANFNNDEDMDSWLKRADMNLYEAKRQGRNQVWPTLKQEVDEPVS